MYEGTITIDLPDLLFGTFQVVTHGRLREQGEELRRIICGLSYLSGPQIKSLPDPPKGHPMWELRVDLEWRYLEKVLEASRQAKLDISTIFCRVFYALINEKVQFVPRSDISAEDCIEVIWEPSNSLRGVRAGKRIWPAARKREDQVSEDLPLNPPF